MTKRILDTTAALLLTIPALPVLLVCALAIRLTSPGPALFRQTRLGRDQRPFTILKLRTMAHRTAIDQIAEGVIAGGTDTRITGIGRFLRASSLDELPQLWNILVGDMSFVGPRPLLPEQLAAVPPEYLDRFNVRPGLTGLAQIRGRRSLDWLDQLAADGEYARTQSLGGDISIALKTFVVVMKREGIYSRAAKNWREYL